MASELRIEVANDLEAVRALWAEYWHSLGLPGTFQNFAAEQAGLPGKYSAPGGILALAFVAEEPAGTIALRRLSDFSCEVKRLYVRPEFRGRGVGRELVRWIITRARELGYTMMHGDTLPVMSDALRMYVALGFRTIDRPYSDAPTPGAIYLELDLTRREL